MVVGEEKKFISKLRLHNMHLTFISIVLKYVDGALLGCNVLGWKLLRWNELTCFSFIVWHEKTMCSKDAEFFSLVLLCLFGGTIVVDASLNPQDSPLPDHSPGAPSPQPLPSARQDFNKLRERATRCRGTEPFSGLLFGDKKL